MKNLSHIVLGLCKRRGGAFEHSLEFARNLSQRGVKTEYYSTWFGSPIRKMNIETFEEIPSSSDFLNKQKGVFYLQTHTWEYNRFLEGIKKETDSRIVYNLHAIIPYYYMGEKEKGLFLEGKLSKKFVDVITKDKMSYQERAQLEAIEKSDFLLTISKSHKRVLENLGIRKPIEVLENVSEFCEIDLVERKREAEEFREKINKKNVLLYCGFLSLKKGSLGLLDSFKQIVEEEPSSALIMVGSGEENKKRFIDYGFKTSLFKNIVFVPWIDKSLEEGKKELLKYYLASDVLIQPMITKELYSKSVVDAMALGIPTITCRSPYTIGSSENSDAIVNSFNFMKDNKGETQRIVNSARAKVKRENTWDFYFSKLDQLENLLYTKKG